MAGTGTDTQGSASRDRTLCILLGSAEYPGDPANNKEFMRDGLLRSYEDFHTYLLSSDGMGLPTDNICSLFGSEESRDEQIDQIERFLQRKRLQMKIGAPIDLIVFFWGHGYFTDTDRFHLAIRDYDPSKAKRTGIAISDLAESIKKEMGLARRYWLLDCCYADAALSAALGSDMPSTQAAPKVDLMRSILPSELDEPQSGSAALTAADRDSKAWVFRRDSRSLFTDLLMGVLTQQDGGQEALSLKDVEKRMQDILRERRADKTRYPDYHDRIVQPRCSDPDRAHGQVSEVPLFPRIVIPPDDPRRRITELLRLDPRTLTCLLVRAEGTSDDFETEANGALSDHEHEIEAAARGSDALPEDLPPFAAETQVKTLGIKDAFLSWSYFIDCVKVICRADIVVFDVTDFQPGTMLLLGIRAVARRGVTVCTLDSPTLEAYRAPLPYCVQVLNVCSHSLTGPESEVRKPRDIIAQKVIEGLTQKRSNPFYLDLPAYDAVRRLGSTVESYRPIPSEEQVLFLCPFSDKYVDHCWNESLGRFFKSRLIASHNKASRQTVRQKIDPEMRRLLDRGSPQIVSQSLYEAVRRTQMCIADWTNLRPNLFFELGVRLACHPLGAVQIIANGDSGRMPPGSYHDAGAKWAARPGDKDRWGQWPGDLVLAAEVSKVAGLSHVRRMFDLFEPLPYRIGDGADGPYDRMIDQHVRIASAPTINENRVYAAVASILPTLEEVRHVTVEEELSQSAAMVGGSDDFNNFTTVLYADANSEIGQRGEKAALERILAAWLYMDARYRKETIAQDTLQFLHFQTLYVAIVGEGKAQFPQDLLDKVESSYKAVTALEPEIAMQTFGLLERGVSNQFSLAKLLKDRRDYKGAIDALDAAILRLDESSWQVRASTRHANREQKRVAQLLTDAYGRVGGHLRRLDRKPEALKNFDKGRQFERNPVLQIASTYNTVNWLILKVELAPESHDRLTKDVEDAARVLESHTQGRRNLDAWAWADLGTCQMLSPVAGRLEQALVSFQRFVQLTDPDSARVPLGVVKTLHASLSRAAHPHSASTQRIIDWFDVLSVPKS